jgi:transporter family protein
MFALVLSLRIFLLGYERIAGKQISQGEDTLIASWAFFTFSLLLFFPFYGYITLESLKLSLLSGIIYTLSFFLYTYALANEDASVVAPLYNVNIFFLLIITFLFLHESVGIKKILGSFLMVYGVSYLKKDKSLFISYKNIFKSKGSFAMIGSSLLLAVGRTFDGYFGSKINTISYSVSIYVVVSFSLLFVSLIKEHSIKKHIDIIKRKKFYLLGGGVANAYSYLALLVMFKYVDVNVAVPLSMLSSIVTAFLAYLIFKEKIALRLVGIFLLIAGSFLMYVA